MGNQWHRQRIYRRRIILTETDRAFFKHTLPSQPTLLGPLAHPKIIMRLRPIPMSLFKSKRSCGIQSARVLLYVHQQSIQSLEVALQLIAQAQETERRVIAISGQYSVGLIIKETEGRSVFSNI